MLLEVFYRVTVVMAGMQLACYFLGKCFRGWWGCVKGGGGEMLCYCVDVDVDMWGGNRDLEEWA